MLGCPFLLLGFSPTTFGTAGQNDRVQMGDCLVELVGIRVGDQVAIEAALVSDSTPELSVAKRCQGISGPLSEDSVSRRVEVSQYTVAV